MMLFLWSQISNEGRKPEHYQQPHAYSDLFPTASLCRKWHVLRRVGFDKRLPGRQIRPDLGQETDE